MEVLLDAETYATFRRLVGSRHMSPALRRMVERFCEQERVKQAIESKLAGEEQP